MSGDGEDQPREPLSRRWGAPQRDRGPLGHCIVPGLKHTEREEKRVDPCRQGQQAGCSFSWILVGFYGGGCLIWGFGRCFLHPKQVVLVFPSPQWQNLGYVLPGQPGRGTAESLGPSVKSNDSSQLFSVPQKCK